MPERDADEICPEATKPSTGQAFSFRDEERLQRRNTVRAACMHPCVRAPLALAPGCAGAGTFLCKLVSLALTAGPDGIIVLR